MKLEWNGWSASYLQSILSDLSYLTAVERLGRILIKRVLWRGDPNDKRIALTFDDGPHPEFTPKLLDILDAAKVPATFFVIGQYVEQFRFIAQDAALRGHELANHSFTHPLLFLLRDKDLTNEIRRTHECIRSITQSKPRFFRPPMGLFSKRVLDRIGECGYQTVVGDVYPRDPHLPGSKKIAHRILNRTQNGSILILHDGGNTRSVDRNQTLDAVKLIIPRLQEMGFQFVTLSQLLN